MNPPRGRAALQLGLCLALLVLLQLATGQATHTNTSLLEHRRSLQAAARGSGFWSVRGRDFVDGRGNVVRWSGVNWAGFETPDAVVHGLWGRSIESHLDQMKSLGFNMIRLPFAGDTLRPSQRPTVNIYGHNPSYRGLTSLQLMDRVINQAGKRGIKVILCYHRMHLTINSEWGLWYDKTAPESTWIGNWVRLAQRYKGNPTVVGADLFNEVHSHPSLPKGAPYWLPNAGVNEKYNFRSACIRVIRAIHAVEPNWIHFLEGMGHNYWWGGDVAALLQYPINWPPGKVAYSSHEYGPYVFMQPWFTNSKFPSNLPSLWRSKWGLAVEQNKALWVGEFGSFFPKPTNITNRIERTTFLTLIAYIKQLNVAWTIAFWNPNSKDTGGILNNDYASVNMEKMSALRSIMHPSFV